MNCLRCNLAGLRWGIPCKSCGLAGYRFIASEVSEHYYLSIDAADIREVRWFPSRGYMVVYRYNGPTIQLPLLPYTITKEDLEKYLILL